MKHVVWTEEAETQLLRLSSADAETVMRAVEILAERSVGFLAVRKR